MRDLFLAAGAFAIILTAAFAITAKRVWFGKAIGKSQASTAAFLVFVVIEIGSHVAYDKGLLDLLIGAIKERVVEAMEPEPPSAEEIMAARLAEPERNPSLDPEPTVPFRQHPTFRDCPDCPEMVVVPAGRFQMGSPPDSDSAAYDEQPQRDVHISEFALSRTEVTFELWQRCASNGGCTRNQQPFDEHWGRGSRPVINISRRDAESYLDWLNSQTSGGYRLPTEAEWEYAARANTESAFWWGDKMRYGVANCIDQQCGEQWDNTSPAGTFLANPWGLWDMNGNVWELVLDCWHGDYRDAPANGSVHRADLSAKDCPTVVARGGSWDSRPSALRSANRFGVERDARFQNLGLRVAKSTRSP